MFTWLIDKASDTYSASKFFFFFLMNTYSGCSFYTGLEFTLQDWTGLNFKSIMDDAEKIRLTVCY
jgi:hypothetical protein